LTEETDPFSRSIAFTAEDIEYVLEVRRHIQSWAGALPEALHSTIRHLSPHSWNNNVEPATELSRLELLPAWLAAYFGITDSQIAARAGLASTLMYWHCCAQDARIDHDSHGSDNDVITEALSNILVSDSLAIFGSIAGANAFGNHVHDAFVDLAEAYRIEGTYAELDRAERARAAANRSAPARILVAALALSAKRQDLLTPGFQITHEVTLVTQIADDITDWRRDLRAGKQSFALATLGDLMGEAPFSTWKQEAVGHALYLYGGLERLMHQQEHCWCSILEVLEQTQGGQTGMAFHSRQMLHRLQEQRAWMLKRKHEALEVSMQVVTDLLPREPASPAIRTTSRHSNP
jgi:hypothetical protein